MSRVTKTVAWWCLFWVAWVAISQCCLWLGMWRVYDFTQRTFMPFLVVSLVIVFAALIETPKS